MGNVALGKKVIANNNTIPPFTGDRALTADLNPLQRWVGVATKGASFVIDLGNTYFLNSFTAKCMTEATGASVQWTKPGFCNYDYQLYYSNDNSTWTPLPDSIASYASVYTGTIPIYPTPYRYVGVKVGKTQINPQVASLVNFTLNEIPCLRSLTISSGTLTPSFTQSVMAYTAAVDSTVSSINIMPTTANPNATLTVNGAPATSGVATSVLFPTGTQTTSFPVVSTMGGQSLTFTENMTRSSSPYLASISGMPANLTPAFGKGTYSYTGSASANLMIKPVSENTGTVAAITVKFGTTTKQVASGTNVLITLATGHNIITITATSTTGTDSRTYTFDITH